MKKTAVVFFASLGVVLIAFAFYKEWEALTFLLMILTMGLMFFQFEKGNITSKELSLIAVLGGVSAVSRVPFAAIPGVQPCTFIIICTGYVFGPLAGFMVGATTAVVSNMFLGHGPWTLFQMFAWGAVGITSSFLQRLKVKQYGLFIFGVAWGYLFGLIMNLWWWLAYVYPHTFPTLLATMGSSLGFDTLHAIGNAVFLLILGEKTIQIFQRYKNRFHIKYGFKPERKPVVS
jgi:energy-coupling factor transport system substrate-specific component